MTIKELKIQIENLPDDMPVVVAQNDNPDFANCDKVEIVSVIPCNEYGYNSGVYLNLSETIKACQING